MSSATTPYQVVLDPKAYEGIRLVESDGIPMETILHRDCRDLLIDVVSQYNRARQDYCVGGDTFLYFNPDQARNLDYRGPDFFYVKDGVDLQRRRRYWAVWEEGGRTPDVILELLSPTTEDVDRTTKFVIYEQTLRTPEYFLYDPFTHVLEGYRLSGGAYRPLAPNKRGRLWSGELGLWLGTWEGEYRSVHETYLRAYTPGGKLVPTWNEAAQRRADMAERRLDKAQRRADEEQRRADEEQRRADEEQRRADEEQRRADEEQRRAEEQQHRADEERRRREAAEAELARLRAMLQQRPPDADS